MLEPTLRYSEEHKEEPTSGGLPGTAPFAGYRADIWRVTPDTRPGGILELGQVFGYAGKRRNKVWAWTALCRRTQQIVTFVNGGRSEQTCRTLWDRIPVTTALVGRPATFGVPMATFFPVAATKVSARSPARPPTWIAGTTPFQRMALGMTGSSSGLSFRTIRSRHLEFSHHF